jgi:hypothetical protein
MWTLPLSGPQKFGVVAYGFVVGALTAIGISLGACLLGFVFVLLSTRIGFDLGETGAWLPLIGLFYGFGAGVLVGLVVWWRVCANRLRKEQADGLTDERIG